MTNAMPDVTLQATSPAIFAHPTRYHTTLSTIRNSPPQQNPILAPLSEIPQFSQKGNTLVDEKSGAVVPPQTVPNGHPRSRIRGNSGKVAALALRSASRHAARDSPGTSNPGEGCLAESRNQKTKAGARLKPGSTGAFASNSSRPLHLPFTGSKSFAFPSGPELTTATSRPCNNS
jgi:hypothetical protein